MSEDSQIKNRIRPFVKHLKKILKITFFSSTVYLVAGEAGLLLLCVGHPCAVYTEFNTATCKDLRGFLVMVPFFCFAMSNSGMMHSLHLI